MRCGARYDTGWPIASAGPRRETVFGELEVVTVAAAGRTADGQTGEQREAGPYLYLADHARRQPTDVPLTALAATMTDLRCIGALQPFVRRVLLDIVVQPHPAPESLSSHTATL